MAKRNFKPVDAGASLGSITFIRPALLAKEERTGIVVEGTYVESLPNQFDDKKSDYKFTDEKGGVTILNGAGNLGFKMKNVNAGDFVQISYNGKKEIKSGKMKGTMAHNFEVLRDEAE
tara:strand:+ start:4975 stop:5328 length:354 start_codon:yes stop_codon:yes gene_type:complete